MMKNIQFVWIAGCIFFLFESILFSQETQECSSCVEDKLSLPESNDEVTLLLSFHNSLGLKPLKPSYSFIQLVIWVDGRVLAGKEMSREENANAKIINYEYCFGKIDLEKVQMLLHSIETNLQLRNHQTRIQNLGPSASTYRLHVNYADGTLEVITWERYELASLYPNSNVIFSDTTSEREVLLLPDFYKGWKIIKKDMFDIRDEILSNCELVDVEWNQKKLFVRDKTGKTILECDRPLASKKTIDMDNNCD